MKKVITLLLAAGLVIGAASAANAVDIKAKGLWHNAMSFADRNFEKHNGSDKMQNATRIRTQIDVIASESLKGITDNVSVLRYRGDKTVICTPDYIEEKYGIFPSQYADFKSLTGDTADNIKGADRIGPKTAAYLLNEFGTLDNILANAEKIEKPFIKDSVIRNAERLKTNYRLIKLGSKVPLPFVLHELKYSYNGITTNEVLKGIKLR